VLFGVEAGAADGAAGAAAAPVPLLDSLVFGVSFVAAGLVSPDLASLDDSDPPSELFGA
jgi:hypothetical protein